MRRWDGKSQVWYLDVLAKWRCDGKEEMWWRKENKSQLVEIKEQIALVLSQTNELIQNKHAIERRPNTRTISRGKF